MVNMIHRMQLGIIHREKVQSRAITPGCQNKTEDCSYIFELLISHHQDEILIPAPTSVTVYPFRARLQLFFLLIIFT